MKQTFGATERHDQLIVYGKGKKAMLIYGYGEENGQGYDWRHEFTHRPTKEEVLEVIVQHIDSHTDLKILTGFLWTPEGSEDGTGPIHVWLSAENQRNYSEAQRMGDVPTTFKLGEDADKKPVYHTFTTVDELDDFYKKAYSYIKQCLGAGWIEKDDAAAWVETLNI